jgi:hypothetical protein
MFKKGLICASLAGSVFMLPAASANDTLARFKGGIGDIPLATSTVRGVPPAGQIWVIDKLEAKVSMNGRISVEGKGLVLGAGNNVGRATGQSVFATLTCVAANDAEQYSSTLTGVPLSVTGDFKIHDTLQPAPPFPCASPALLIRNAANGGWFAAGILRLRDDD